MLSRVARSPAMADLLRAGLEEGQVPTKAAIGQASGNVTAIFLLGWATGGLIFGVVGDRWGRAKTMMLTILLYSGFTGLSALSTTFWDFALYRFMTGLGVGGEFAVGIALVAEVMPTRARPYALSLLQALSAVGNVSAAGISITLGQMEETGLIGQMGGWPAWRWMFIIGAAPALLVVWIRRGLKEPDRWLAARKDPEIRTRMGDYGELFGNPEWRLPASIGAVFLAVGVLYGLFGAPALFGVSKSWWVFGLSMVSAGFGLATLFGGGGDTTYRQRTVVGLLLALSGVIGIWGISFFSVDLVRSVFEKRFIEMQVPLDEIPGKLTTWVGITSLVQNVAAFFGIYAFGLVAQHLGRRKAFAIALTAAMVSTALTFGLLRDFAHVFILIPLMGFCTLSVFGGYAVYLPELFPTRLRSTGTSFCYNVGRFVAAAGPALLGVLTGVLYKDAEEPLRYAGVTMCAVYLVGLLTLPFAPETKGKPLPEEEPEENPTTA
jgi:MFS family permease